VAVVAVVALSSVLTGASVGATRPDPRASRVATSMRQLFRGGALNSMVFGVWVDGRPLVTGALGSALQGVPATRDMHFRIGNVAESMTTTLLLKYVEQRKVSLNAPVSNWFPGLARARQVTLRMLATSTSGYGDYVTSAPFEQGFAANPFQQFSTMALIGLGTSLPPLFAPGKSWAFSDTNFLLLGAILQKIAHRPLAAVLKQRIFGPLGLSQTAMRSNAYIPPPVMHSYTRERGPYEDATFWTPSWVALNGAVTTNLVDMGKWAAALGTGSLLSGPSRGLQLGPGNVGLGPLTAARYYGMGAVVAKHWVVTDPQVDGYTGTVNYFPPKKIAVVVFSTVGPTSVLSKQYGIAALLRIARILTPRSVPELSASGRVK
jgi:CubicO group peptidase (beta-lactamase class C family)